MVPNLTDVVTVAHRRSKRSGRERWVCRGVPEVQTRRDQSQRVQRASLHRVVKESQLASYFSRGWHYVATLPSGGIVIGNSCS